MPDCSYCGESFDSEDDYLAHLETIHEGDGEQFLDCPQCGSPASLTQIIETGRCTGQLDAEETETYAEDQQLQETGCTADLSLELVWEA